MSYSDKSNVSPVNFYSVWPNINFNGTCQLFCIPTDKWFFDSHWLRLYDVCNFSNVNFMFYIIYMYVHVHVHALFILKCSLKIPRKCRYIWHIFRVHATSLGWMLHFIPFSYTNIHHVLYTCISSDWVSYKYLSFAIAIYTFCIY